MKKRLLFSVILIVFATCDNGRSVDNDSVTSRKFCLTHYHELMLTIPDLVTKKFYKERNLENFETLTIDTSSSTLYVKYKFKYNVDDYKMQVYNLVIFEPNEEETIRTYSYYEPTFESGLNSVESRHRMGTKVVNDKLSFGEESHAYEYWKNGHVVGYVFMGRSKNLMVMYSIMGDNVGPNYFEILKERIDRINIITAASGKV